MRIRIQDPENVHTHPDPGKILSVINLKNLMLPKLEFFVVDFFKSRFRCRSRRTRTRRRTRTLKDKEENKDEEEDKDEEAEY